MEKIISYRILTPIIFLTVPVHRTAYQPHIWLSSIDYSCNKTRWVEGVSRHLLMKYRIFVYLRKVECHIRNLSNHSCNSNNLGLTQRDFTKKEGLNQLIIALVAVQAKKGIKGAKFNLSNGKVRKTDRVKIS